MPGTLYLFPNLISDGTVTAALPPDVRSLAGRIDHWLVEAAKSARGAIRTFGHPKPVAELSIVEIGHDPDPTQIDAWLEPLRAGFDMAVLSESGCPGVADPGAQIAARVQAAGGRVVPLVGPSSILLTLMASGLDGQRFRFLGYLPIREDERRAAIKHAESESRASETQLFIETPYRNSSMMTSLVETLAADTRLTVATDVTGAAESIRTMRVDAWKRFWLEQPEEARALPKLPTVFALLAAPSGAVAPRYAPVGASRKGEKKGEKHGTFAKSVKSDKRGKPAGYRAQAAKSSHADRTSTGRPTKGARR